MAAIAFVAGMSVQCSGSGQDCFPGEEGCECVFAECVGDLVCQSAVCVDLTPGDDTDETPMTETTDPTASTDPTTTDPTATTQTTQTTDPTGATDDTGDTTPGTSATTEPAAVCGDGNVDAGESCDDGNDNNGDACTNACQPGGEPPMFVLLDPKPTMVLGPTDGPSFGDKCDGVLRGLNATEQPGAYVLSVQGTCATGSVTGGPGSYTLGFAGAETLPSQGVGGGTASALECPAGAVATGLQLYKDSVGMSGLELRCTPLSIDPNTLAVKFGSPAKTALVGSAGQVLGDAFCPADYVATGLLGFLYTSDNSVIALGLHCARPVVQ